MVGKQAVVLGGEELRLCHPHRILVPGRTWRQMVEHVVDHQHHVLLRLDERQNDHWGGAGGHLGLDLPESVPRHPSQGDPYHHDHDDARHDVGLDRQGSVPRPPSQGDPYHLAAAAAYLPDRLRHIFRASYVPVSSHRHHIFRVFYDPVSGHRHHILRASYVPVSGHRPRICGI